MRTSSEMRTSSSQLGCRTFWLRRDMACRRSFRASRGDDFCIISIHHSAVGISSQLTALRNPDSIVPPFKSLSVSIAICRPELTDQFFLIDAVAYCGFTRYSNVSSLDRTLCGHLDAIWCARSLTASSSNAPRSALAHKQSGPALVPTPAIES
jgi:hypothetical protein